jgi:hypothetical protein
MAQRTHTLVLHVPPQVCYDLFLGAGNTIRDWKLLRADSTNHTLCWKQKTGGLFSMKIESPVETSVTMVSLDDGQTEVRFVAKHYGLTDPFDFLNKALLKLAEALQSVAEDWVAIRDGLMCPKCLRKLEAGTQFCPHDGTPITRACPNPDCGRPNPLQAKFCPACGTQL